MYSLIRASSSKFDQEAKDFFMKIDNSNIIGMPETPKEKVTINSLFDPEPSKIMPSAAGSIDSTKLTVPDKENLSKNRQRLFSGNGG